MRRSSSASASRCSSRSPTRSSPASSSRHSRKGRFMNLNFTLFAQAAAFILFIWFTVKFVWPPLLRAIETRQKTIADGLAEAERGRSSLADAQKQTEVILKDARSRAQEILAV